MIISCVPALSFAADAPTGGIDGMGDYLKYSVSLESDGYIDIPVDIYTYHKDTTTSDMPIVMYVINTNTEHIGTDSDYKIVNELVNEKNCIVVVIDYKNNPLSVCPDLDWSVQGIRTNANNGKYFTSSSIPYKKGYTYVVPSGYNITFDEFYWAIDKHGADGTLEYIVDVWNNDFKGVKGNQEITYSDGTVRKVSEVTATSIYDCVKKDGTPIDMDLKMDIIYPTNPDHKVPVYICNSSSEYRVDSWTAAKRPHLSGFLFSGYAGVVFDYGYVPMARTDHYGYFDGDGSGSVGGITGDNYTYSVSVYNEVKSDTAAIRKIRWLADHDSDKYRFDVNKFGIYGNSKGGLCTRLGEQHPEKLREQRYFDGHYGETRYDNGKIEDDEFGIIRGGEEQPWLKYQDETEIPSNVQFVYANCGGGYNDITEGHAPTYASGSMKDGSYQGFYPGVINACRSSNVPCLYLSMPDLAHALVYGTDKDYGLDGYAAFFDMAHYYLKGAGPILEYIDMGKDLDNVDAKAEIKFKFAGSIPEEQIKKITVQNTETGEIADGSWSDSFGNTEWVFKAKKLVGGAKYIINVPTTITGDNDAALQKGRTLSFTVKSEQLVSPEKITGDNGLTLLKTETADDAVYSLYTGVDFANSTTTDIRFAVTNDAANNVLVYALKDIDETDLKNSTVGELLGEVAITGKGDYDLDITNYVKSLGSNKAAFMFKAKKNKATKVISKYDFESDAVGATSPKNVTADSRMVRAVSDEKNTTDGGSNSLKISYMLHNNYKAGKYHVWIPENYQVAQISQGVTGSKLTGSDMGRKFNISFKLYDETSRRVFYRLTPWSSSNYDNIDWDANMYYKQTTPNQWDTYSFDYRIDDDRDIRINKNTINIYLESTMQEGKRGAAYIDDITVTESITEVNLADESSEILPSIVIHPSDKHNLQSKSAAYVESGVNAENEMTDGVFVSGRAKAVDANAKKTYIKLDLSEYEGGQAYFGFKAVASSKGKIKVYGLEDTSWSEDTINYYNAPANDRFGYGVIEDETFDKIPLGEFDISGEEEYSVDVTSFAMRMKALGKTEATLVFVNEDKTTKVVYQNDFSDNSYKATAGGSLGGHGVDRTYDHTSGIGSSYKMSVAQYAYERLRFNVLDSNNLTKADVGRKFKLTYWVRANTPVSYYNSLMNIGTTDSSQQIKRHTIATADTWQKMSYEFKLRDSDIAETEPAKYNRGYVNFEGAPAGTVLYIDDMVLEEVGFGSVAIIPLENAKMDKVVSSINFDDWTSIENKNYESDNGVEKGYYAATGFEFDKTPPTKVELASDVDATSGSGKSVKFTPNKNYNRLKFYNTFDHDLTKADIGRKVKISFKLRIDGEGEAAFSYGLMSKVTRNGYYPLVNNDEPDTKDYGGEFYPKGYTATVSADDVGKWKKYSFEVTVDELMLPKAVQPTWSKIKLNCGLDLLTILPGTSAIGRPVYIDDILVTEPDAQQETKTPYTYSQDFENVKAQDLATTYIDANALEFRFVDNDTGTCWIKAFGGKTSKTCIDTRTISKTENTTVNGSKSVKLLSHSPYNRFRFKNITDTLTEDKIGMEYKVSFMLKADRVGFINTGIIGETSNKNTYTDGGKDVNSSVYAKTAAKLNVDEANVWKKYTYSFTVDKEMVDKNLNCLYFNPSFGQVIEIVDGKDPDGKDNQYNRFINTTEIYIDDIYSTEVIPGAGTALTAKEAVSVSAGETNKNTLYVYGSAADSEARFIRKAFIRFDGGAYEKTQKATLAVDIAKGSGQKVYVWALTGEYPEKLTYMSAPGYSEDEKVNNAYGGVALASFTADRAETHYVDVTDYVKAHAPNEYIFAITCEDAGGCEYLSYDFENSVPFVKGIDYAAFGGYEGNAAISGGELNVSGAAAGQGIKLLNVFGGSGAAVSAGEEYSVSLDVTSNAAGEFEIGAVNAEGKTAYSANYSLSADTKQTITLSFTATKENADDLINAIYVKTADAADFKIDNVAVSSRNAVEIGTCGLEIETAKDGSQPDEPVQKISLTVSAAGGGTFSINGGAATTESIADYETGTKMTLTAAANEGHKFAYWTDKASNRVVSSEATFKFTIGAAAKSYEATFVPENTDVKVVIFRNKNGQILLNKSIGKDDSETVTVPANPMHVGYDFKGWLKSGNAAISENVKADTTLAYDSAELAGSENLFLAQYKKITTPYTVTVTGGKILTAGSTFTYDSNVKVEADAAPEGKVFSHWTKDGVTVSYDKVYKFIVSGNTELVANYADSAPAKTPIVSMYEARVLSGNSRIAFFSERSVPMGYTYVGSGIILRSGDAAANADLTLESEGKIVSSSTSQEASGQYLVRKAGLSQGDTWSARAYLTYIDDATNKVVTIYSNVADAMYSE
mgnify:CR=1 FL=1